MNFKWALQGEEHLMQEAWAVRRQVFIEEQGINPLREIDGQDLQSIHLIGYMEGIPVANTRLQENEGTLTIQRVAVLQAYRGNHIGLKMMKEIEDWAIAKENIHTLRLSSQEQVTPFYEKIGYQIISEPYLDAGINHVAMEKKI